MVKEKADIESDSKSKQVKEENNTVETTKSKFGETLERWKLYAEISELGMVARRFFVKNMTDGILTTLGVVIGFFVAFLNDPDQIPNNSIIVLPGVGTAVAMCVSGVAASYLVESAERRKALLELRREMVMVEPKKAEEDMDKELKKEMKKRKKKMKTLQEKAESFATIVASLIDGFSPFVAAMVMLIPFMFTASPELWEFLASIIAASILLFLLGTYLAKLSKMNRIIYGLKMVAMGVLTLLITLALGQF